MRLTYSNYRSEDDNALCPCSCVCVCSCVRSPFPAVICCALLRSRTVHSSIAWRSPFCWFVCESVCSANCLPVAGCVDSPSADWVVDTVDQWCAVPVAGQFTQLTASESDARHDHVRQFSASHPSSRSPTANQTALLNRPHI